MMLRLLIARGWLYYTIRVFTKHFYNMKFFSYPCIYAPSMFDCIRSQPDRTPPALTLISKTLTSCLSMRFKLFFSDRKFPDSTE